LDVSRGPGEQQCKKIGDVVPCLGEQCQGVCPDASRDEEQDVSRGQDQSDP